MSLKFLRWSSLRSIGQSKVAGLTIIVPFIGWIILFNNNLIEFINLSPSLFHSDSVGSSETQTSDQASKVFTLSSLYFSYFGLTFVGIASFLFRVFCPQSIKNCNSNTEYVVNEIDSLTDTGVGLIAQETASMYRNQDYYRNSRIRSLYMSNEFLSQMDAVVGEMYLSDDLAIRGEEARKKFVTAMDTPIIDAILEEVDVNRRASRSIVEGFKSSARNRKNDFLRMNYLSKDVYLPYVRSVIFLLYSIGFLLLFIPTARTAIKIVGLALA